MLRFKSTTWTRSSAWARLNTWFTASIAPALHLSFAASGGGSDNGPTPNPIQACNVANCRARYVGLTDADGDFLSYSVDVVSLTLERANGDTVETLPVRQRVDFAELVDLTEFVTAATVPNAIQKKIHWAIGPT